MNRRVLLIGLLVVLPLVGVLVANVGRDPHTVRSPLVGRPAPLFSLRAVGGGGSVSLASLRGRPVVVNFWATWCAPCREEMPLLVALQKRYQPRGVQVIGASTDDESTQKNIPRFVRRLKLNFPIWVGAATADMRRLGLGDALPATAIVDRDGQTAARILGPFTPADLETRLVWLLGERREPAPAALVNNIKEGHRDNASGKPAHSHAKGEEHEHGGVGIEGASTVPS